MKLNKLIIVSVIALFGMVSLISITNAAVITAPGQNKLQCFDGKSEGTIYGGDCTLFSNSAKKGLATLDNTDGDVNGSYAGVYIANSNLNVKNVGNMESLSFNYIGTATAGSPRFSIPVDTTGDSLTDGYLFVSAYYCNDGAGVVDAINDSTCTIYTNFSNEFFVNWDALVLAHPTWTLTQDSSFIVADDVGVWAISNVMLGQAVKR